MKDMSTITSDWMTVSDAAKALGCNARTVLRLVQAGNIEHVEVNPRMYLVKKADVDAEKGRGYTFGRPRGS